jgi:hypothetical protein
MNIHNCLLIFKCEEKFYPRSNTESDWLDAWYLFQKNDIILYLNIGMKIYVNMTSKCLVDLWNFTLSDWLLMFLEDDVLKNKWPCLIQENYLNNLWRCIWNWFVHIFTLTCSMSKPKIFVDILMSYWHISSYRNKQNHLCYHVTRCKIIWQKLKIETWRTFQSQDLLID